MKTMTCSQLGGACEAAFQAETFEEIAAMSKAHGNEMFQKGDKAHLQAMHKMRDLMHQPDAMQQWLDEKKKAFVAMPVDE